ncbi:MAG: hypothetical protein HFF67_09455 [Oscillospiraceae bacterium]|jgi:hypothetical protein|nr:hypothetical protein [Oscillospiraceae bacterium]MCI9318252.1 hypothetical protein [Oscillospiraceae bacterium]
MEKLLESDLYGPVRSYLEGLGYDVKGEVKDCDVAAVRDGELIVVELKRGFTLELVFQAMDRQRVADGVYVAVPLPKRGYMDPRVPEMRSLCRRLELGLIFVGFTSRGAGQVDVAVHPKEASAPRRDKKRRLAVLREHGDRTGSANTGGVSRKKILTAYKEQALLAVRILRDRGPLTAADVKKLGGPPNAAAILGRNALGWFDRTPGPDGRRYLYAPNEKALAALEEYGHLL